MRIGLINVGVIIAYFLGCFVGWISTRKKVAEYRRRLEDLQKFEKMTQERNNTEEGK